jgi:hypothetical protein
MPTRIDAQGISRRLGRWLRSALLLVLPILFSGARPAPNYRILISLEEKFLWLFDGRDVVLRAPIAVGISEDFVYKGRKFNFDTPRGRRTILKKEENPVWTVPEWHYLEKATHKNLEIVHVVRGRNYALGDGSYIRVRDNEVGRVNQFGNFWPFTPGIEIIFYGKLYVPPLDTPQRRVPDALGPYKLDMGSGYLIHGTHIYNENSIGLPASHGCVRMRNEDLALLYQVVPVGTAVYIN